MIIACVIVYVAVAAVTLGITWGNSDKDVPDKIAVVMATLWPLAWLVGVGLQIGQRK